MDFHLSDFWSWNQSDLIENRTRGILAEFIVKKALNIDSERRVEWDNFDLITNTGKKLEVKSAAYIQSWEQSKFSDIKFGISPTLEQKTIQSMMESKDDGLIFMCSAYSKLKIKKPSVP